MSPLKFTKYEKNSLASIIDSENSDARAYINYSCGNVIMVNDAMELEKYPQSITNDRLIYRGYTVSSLNPNVEKPFMGKNAASKASEIWQEKAKEAKANYVALNEELEKEIEMVTNAVYNHSDKGRVDTLFDEVLKDADALQHCLRNPMEDFWYERGRVPAILKELGVE